VNGAELWSYQLPLHSTAPPASYEAHRRQFIVVPVTGGGTRRLVRRHLDGFRPAAVGRIFRYWKAAGSARILPSLAAISRHLIKRA